MWPKLNCLERRRFIAGLTIGADITSIQPIRMVKPCRVWDILLEGITGYVWTRGYWPGLDQSGDYFYTTNPKGEAAPMLGYTSEGITGYVAKTQLPGTTVLYRWVNHQSGYHFYTTDPGGETASSIGYSLEGVTGYVWTSGYRPGLEPTTLYPLVNHQSGDHFYTTIQPI